jgi:hypothetical protein
MANRWVRLAFAATLLGSVSILTAWAKTDFFRIEDLRPGMKGIGRTCVRGFKPEEFQVEILGTLHGVNPGVSVVLARFSGAPLEKTGVFEGMSGSPVFIEGKLLGAIAYSFSFSKEAIGGITPITQMVDAFKESAKPVSGTAILPGDRLPEYRMPPADSFRASTGYRVSAGDIRAQPSLAAFGGRALVPIATPLSLAGLHRETLRMFGPRFSALGMSMLQGGAGNGLAAKGVKQEGGEPFEPGSNIVIPLVRGDLEVSAGGTVTYVDGNRLYAFGHSMLELGFTELPLHKGKAITVVPSLESSFKILEIGEQAGTIHQDRGVGIYGVVGEMPRTVPLRIQLVTSRLAKKEFRYEIVRDPLLTPLLVNLAVYNTIVTTERAQGTVTVKVKGKIDIRNEQAVEIDTGFSSDSDAPSAASLAVAVPVHYLMAARYSNLDIRAMDLEISAQESDQTAVLDSVRSPRSEVRAGESLELEIHYKKLNGEVIKSAYPVRIPSNMSPGSLTLLVADGSTLMSLDAKEEGQAAIPRDLTQLIKYINNLRRNNRVYVRFYRQEPGAVVKGEGLPGLPPSILAILRSDRKAGAATSLQISTLAEYELPGLDCLVSGAKALKLVAVP